MKKNTSWGSECRQQSHVGAKRQERIIWLGSCFIVLFGMRKTIMVSPAKTMLVSLVSSFLIMSLERMGYVSLFFLKVFLF